MLTALLLHVTLAFPCEALPGVTLAHAVAEAAAIWAPHGVTVDAADPCAGDAVHDGSRLTIAIVTSSPRAAADWRGPLGAITFEPDGTPGSTIMVYLSSIRWFIRDTRVLGVEECRWPDGLRDLIIGRVVGRVLAHEIGHYVLQSPRHTASGLMRPMHTANTLVEPSRSGFELSASDISRLAAGGRKRTGPASAGPERPTTAGK
jgi:hypothetical protein